MLAKHPKPSKMGKHDELKQAFLTHSSLSRTWLLTVLLVGGTAFWSCSNDKRSQGSVKVRNEQYLSEDTLSSFNTVHPSAQEQAKVKEGLAPIVFSPAQVTILNQGLAIANQCIQDTVFQNVLRELAKENKIEWGVARLEKVERRHWAAPTEYFLTQYASRGGPAFTDLVAVQWDNARISSSVVACTNAMNMNVNALNRSASRVAGTFVHERAHVFCHKHIENDVTQNECDFAYQAGDLAWMLSLYRVNNSGSINKPGYVMCNALVSKLRKRKIIK